MLNLGECNWLPCISPEVSDSNCTGKMIGTYGGQSYQHCYRCGGRVTVRQYLNSSCDCCFASFSEVFEFCCNTCCNYGLSDRISICDPECDDISYSFSGIGYPLAEVDDLETLMLEAAVNMQEQIRQQHNTTLNLDEF